MGLKGECTLSRLTWFQPILVTYDNSHEHSGAVSGKPFRCSTELGSYIGMNNA